MKFKSQASAAVRRKKRARDIGRRAAERGASVESVLTMSEGTNLLIREGYATYKAKAVIGYKGIAIVPK